MDSIVVDLDCNLFFAQYVVLPIDRHLATDVRLTILFVLSHTGLICTVIAASLIYSVQGIGILYVIIVLILI